MKIQFSDKAYETLKWLCLIALPAVSTLYWALASLWGWPYSEQISGTIAAVGTFLGTMIGVSTANYRRGSDED